MRNLKLERPQPVRTLMLYPEGALLRTRIEEYFNSDDGYPVKLVASTSLPDRCRSMVREVFPQVVLLVDINNRDTDWTTQMLRLSKDINLDYPNVATVLLTNVKPEEMSSYYDQAINAGARGVINIGRLGEGMVEEFGRIQRAILQAAQFIRHRGGDQWGAQPLGELQCITVTSGKGGVGKSVIAATLAGEIARQRLDKRVILVDLDVQYGALAPMLGIAKPKNSLVHLAAMSTADITRIQNFNDFRDFVEIISVGNGANLYLMAAPASPSESFAMGPDSTREILYSLRRVFDYVIVDLATQITDVSIAAFQASDLMLLVCEPEMLAVRTCRQLLQLLSDPTVGNPAANVRVVLNKVWGKREHKAWGKPPVQIDDVEKLFPDMIVGRLPVEPIFINEYISSGEPIGRRSGTGTFVSEIGKVVNALGISHRQEKSKTGKANDPAKATKSVSPLFGGVLGRLRG